MGYKTLFSTACVLVAMGSAPVMAGVVTDKVPTGVGCGVSGECYANFAGDKFGPVACESRQLRWDGTSSEGKNLTAAVLTAKAGAIAVNIGYEDTCAVGAVSPTPTFVTLN